MKKTTKQRIFGVIVLGLAIAAILANPHLQPAPGPLAMKEETIDIRTASGNTRYTVEIAQTMAQKTHGLMERGLIPPDHGMIFLWPEDSEHNMWMKNTLVPLDMLFIDSHGKIVFIANDATPNSEAIISAHRPTRAVIELAGGQAAAHGIKVGDQVLSNDFTP